MFHLNHVGYKVVTKRVDNMEKQRFI